MWREILSTRGSLLVCTRLAGDNAASASDDSGKSAYTHTHTCIHTRSCSFLSINSTDQENPPNACDVGETQAGAQDRGTKTTAVQSNRRGTSCGRGGSRLIRTRLSGGDPASASRQ